MDGLRRLADAWHERVIADPVVSHAFRHGFRDDHTARLAAYWAEALGGPGDYSGAYGDESEVVRLHSGNGIHEDFDDQAILLFDQALVDAGFTDEPLRTVLHDYFAWATRVSMNQFPESDTDVPSGMAMPHWSWGGLVALSEGGS
jgi:hemoglobin